jgi:hypothetical protein
VSEPIRNGDLVQIVRPSPCCGGGDSIGHVFEAREVGGTHVRCAACGRRTMGPSAGDASGYYFPLTRLKRIPPLSELEGEKTQEDIREPA